MQAQRMQADPMDRTDIYRDQIKHLAELRKVYQETAMASGDWSVQTVKAVSASQRLTEQIQKQKVTMTQAAKEYVKFQKTGQGALAEAIREQTALRHSMLGQMTANTFGKNEVDLITPKQITPELEKARVKYGMINQLISAAAQNTVNWGKNTQWAGRQITVGMTMPLGMAAAAGAALAYQVDKELTNIARVYDTVATTAAGKEAELAQLRETSLKAATQMTKEYAVAAKDVLGIQSQLAATGLNGTQLQQFTQETMRVATLGDFDPTVAAEMTISLSTAFRDQIKTIDDLKETYDFYNIVAQETSLQMEDIAAAIPRAASAMSTLGVTTKEMGVLMVALRESGVDPEVGANALKSATSTLLDPTKEAIDYWKTALNKDLPAIVEEAGGNLYTFLKLIGEELNGIDPQVKQTAITKTFGKYQFDRATALVTNFGDAMTGTANQTKTAMDLIGESASSMAEKSAAELATLQESASFKFRAAFENIKNSLIPLGEATMAVLTPIMNFVASMIENFNGLNPMLKNFLIVLGVGAALVGPFLMLIGIFANLMGNVIKFGTGMRNLVLRFKAVNAEEAAANIMAKNAASAFDSQARSTAMLTQKIDALTTAFRNNAAAQGLMMGDDGTIVSRAAKPGAEQFSRQVVQDKAGRYRYAKGSRDEQGNPLNGYASRQDRENFLAMQSSSADIAANSTKTEKNFDKIGRNIGAAAGVGVMGMSMMAGSSDAINDKWINIALVASSAFMMFPNMISGMVGGFGKILEKAKAIGPALNGGNIKKNFSLLTSSARPLDTLKTLAPQFTRVAGVALRIFGPVGILAGGALIVRKIVSDMHEVAAASSAMASTTEAWSQALGYSYVPGQLPGMDEADVSNSQKAATLAKEMADSVDGLADAFANVSDKGEGFDRAMQQALKVVTTGGSVEQARQAFEASLQMMDIDEVTMRQLMVKFDRIDLSDPESVRAVITDQIERTFDGSLGVDIAITPSEDADGAWQGMSTWIEEKLGGDLSGPVEALARDLGSNLTTAINAAGDNIHVKADAFEAAAGEASQIFDGMFQEVIKDDRVADLFDEFGIKTADEFARQWPEIRKRAVNNTGSASDEELNKLFMNNEDIADAFNALEESYDQFMDNFIDGMIKAGIISEAEGKRIKDEINSIAEVQDRKLGASTTGTLGIEEVEKKYTRALASMQQAGKRLGSEEHLLVLNTHRAMLGLEDAETVAQGFGNATETAAGQVDELSNAISGIPDPNGIITYNQDNYQELVDMRQQILRGASSDMMAEANRQFDEARSAVIDGLQAQQDAIEEGYEDQEKAQDAHFDRLERDQDAYWEGRIEGAENYWDAQEEAAQDAADAEDAAFEKRIQGIRDTIEAEQDAEEKRKRIFEAEQQRIDRMAERLNSNIDFNIALNSGDLDQAARISNEVSAREQKWSNEDANLTLESVSEQRIADLEAQIEGLETQREQRREWHEERLNQIQEARDSAIEALKTEQEAARENLAIQRQIAEEGLAARREADRKALESRIASEQRQTEADRRGLADRLRALQEFVPQNEQELRDHTAEVERIYQEYGVHLQWEGGKWAGIVGKALDDNVDIAATNLQTSINWKGIAANIAGQIGEGLGMTMEQVRAFLQTGTLPPGPQSAPPVGPSLVGGMSMADVNRRDYGGQPARHTGGEIGGSGYSQKDRTGVPRSASPYPSEELIIAKTGEYMVNAKAYRNNKDLVQRINNGEDIGAPVGPLSSFATGIAGMHMMSALQVAGIAARGKLVQAIAERDAAAAAAASMGSTGVIADGNMPWERLWNTIRGRFPQAGLNSAYNDRRGSNDYHGRGMAVDLGLRGTPGGVGNMFMAEMNRWIYDNFRGSTELIYNGLGDDRPNLKNGRDFAYNAATQLQHRNHVHWAMTPEAIAAAGVKIASGGTTPVGFGGDSVRGIVQSAANQRGWGAGDQWAAIDWVINKESSWNPNAQNPRSTASGLFQHIDSTWNAYKRPGVAAPKMRLAPVAEQAWAGMNYFGKRYGSPAQARVFWQRNGWYDNGGYLMPGENQIVSNGTRVPEPVFTGPQWDILKANIGNARYDLPGRPGTAMPVKVVDNVASGEQNVYDITIDLRGAYVKEEIDIQTAVEKAIDAREARNGRRRVIK